MSGHSSLEKYTSHFIRKGSKGLRKVLCVRGELETEQNWKYWSSNSSGYNIISFLFSWVAQLGTWGLSLCWDMVLIPAFSLQLTDFLSHPGYIIVLGPTSSCGVTIRTQFNPSTVKVIPRYLQPDAPVIYTGAFLICQLGRVGGHYVSPWLDIRAKKSFSKLCIVQHKVSTMGHSIRIGPLKVTSILTGYLIFLTLS